MKISVCNYYNNDNVYVELEDASSAQVSAYIGAEVINFNGLELFKNTVVMDIVTKRSEARKLRGFNPCR